MLLSQRHVALGALLLSVALFGCNAILGNKSPEDLIEGGLGGEGDTEVMTSNSGDGDGDSPTSGGASGSGGSSGNSGGEDTKGSGGSEPDPDTDGCYDDDNDAKTECIPWTTCETGSFVLEPGTESTDRSCGDCDSGYYSDKKNSTMCTPCAEGTFASETNSPSCTPWTACDWDELKTAEATITTDYLCGAGSIAREFDTAAEDTGVSTAVDAEENVYLLINSKADLSAPDDVDPYCSSTDSCPDSTGLVIKYDRFGVERWRTEVGTSEDDTATDIAVDSKGNVYVSGDTLGAFSGMNLGESDGFLVKLSTDGELRWARGLATTGAEMTSALFIDVADFIYVVGSTSGSMDGTTQLGSYDFFARQYNGDGDVIWTHQLGSEDGDFAHAIAVDGQGFVYLTGYTYADSFYDKYRINDYPYSEETVVLIFDPTDNPIAPFAHRVNFTTANYSRGVAIAALEDGSYYLAAKESAGIGGHGHIGKFDQDGSDLWDSYNDLNGDREFDLTELMVDSQGNPIVVASTDFDANQTGMANLLVRMMDTNGGTQWTKNYGTEDLGNSSEYDDIAGHAALAPSGRVYISTTTSGQFSSDGGLAKLQEAAVLMVDVPALDAAN